MVVGILESGKPITCSLLEGGEREECEGVDGWKGLDGN